MTRTRFLVALSAALAVGAAALGPAREARSAPCAGSVDESRRHMERGFALYDRKQFAEAGAEFDAAYRAQPFSAFLCNAAMAYQEALDFPNAILRYKAFLAAEPNPPDLPRIKTMLAWLEAQHAAHLAAHPAADGGSPRPAPDAADAGPAEAAPAPPAAEAPPPPPVQMSHSFRSQVIVISDPPDAPLTVWARRPGAAPFAARGPNPGWDKVASGVKTPHDLSLAAGGYHVVIDAFKDYKRSETDLELLPGRLYEFKANLSQGEFMGFLRVLSDAPGALLFLDDPPPHRKPPWGRASHGALVESGGHEVWIEAPGYEPTSVKVDLEHGKTVELAPSLARVAHGYLRVDGNADEVTVKVDGVPRGIYTPTGEPLRVRLPGGNHAITLEAEGRKTYTGDVEVPRGQGLGVHGRLSYKPSRGSAVATGALTVGAIVGGIALFQQAAQPQPKPAPGMAPANTPTYLRIGGGVSFGLSALFGFSTVYAIAHDPTPPSRVQLDKPRDLDEPEAEPPTPAGPPRRIFGGRGIRRAAPVRYVVRAVGSRVVAPMQVRARRANGSRASETTMNERRRFLHVIGGSAVAVGMGCSTTVSGLPGSGGGGGGAGGATGGAGGATGGTGGAGTGGAGPDGGAGTDGSAGTGTMCDGGPFSNGSNNDVCQSDRGVFSVGKPTDYPTAGLYKVSNIPSNVMIGRDADGFYAISSLCTHSCCDMNDSQQGFPFGSFTVINGKKVIQCNCHGSAFAYDGTVVRSPATTPLDAYQLYFGCDGVLYADTSKIVPRTQRIKVL